MTAPQQGGLTVLMWSFVYSNLLKAAAICSRLELTDTIQLQSAVQVRTVVRLLYSKNTRIKLEAAGALLKTINNCKGLHCYNALEF